MPHGGERFGYYMQHTDPSVEERNMIISHIPKIRLMAGPCAEITPPFAWGHTLLIAVCEGATFSKSTFCTCHGVEEPSGIDEI